MSILVEICCGSVEDVIESGRGGADRVELCSALPLGGLTPSIGTITESKRLSTLPLMVMIRPRSGGFSYSDVEFVTMERDIDLARENGADGVVFGVLTSDGNVDIARTRKLVRRAAGLTTVFHRAFDVTPDPFESLAALIDLGITRLLTSGQKPQSLEGAELIRKLVDLADNRIEIMPGGGVRLHNIREIVRMTNCKQVHLTAHRKLVDTSTHANRAISFGSDSDLSEDRVDMVDDSVVAAIVQQALSC